MWILKVKLNPKESFFGSLAIKHNVAIFGCPLSYTYKNKELILQFNGVLIGKNKNAFIKDLKKTKRIVSLEQEKDFIVGTYKTNIPVWLKQTEIAHAAHLSVDFNGEEILTIEAIKKTPLQLLLKILKMKYAAELISLSKQKSSTIPVLRTASELTAKQRQAFELALKNGYYKYPRQISVKELAKLSKIAFSTYQQHLRKAESKLLPIL